jgi:hypothetical protein
MQHGHGKKIPHKIPHTSATQINQTNSNNTIALIFKTKSTRSTHQNDMKPILNQEVCEAQFCEARKSQVPRRSFLQFG